MPIIKFDSEQDVYILSDDFFLVKCNVDEDKFKHCSEAHNHRNWLEDTEECGGFAVALQNGFYFVVYRNTYPISLESIAGYYNYKPELMDIEHVI